MGSQFAGKNWSQFSSDSTPQPLPYPGSRDPDPDSPLSPHAPCVPTTDWRKQTGRGEGVELGPGVFPVPEGVGTIPTWATSMGQTLLATAPSAPFWQLFPQTWSTSAQEGARE